MISEQVRAVFGRAGSDADFDRFLWADPEGAGKAAGLTGTDLMQLVGEITWVRRNNKAREPQMQVLRDIELHRLGNGWPFANLDSAELEERSYRSQVR